MVSKTAIGKYRPAVQNWLHTQFVAKNYKIYSNYLAAGMPEYIIVNEC